MFLSPEEHAFGKIRYFCAVFKCATYVPGICHRFAARHLQRLHDAGLVRAYRLQIAAALFEYCFQVPANRIGSAEFGGPFSIWELKVVQEVISLTIFAIFALVFMKSDSLRWNHIAGFLCLILAVYFIFRK